MEEGWKLLSNLGGMEPANLPVGLPVKVIFSDAGSGLNVPILVPE